MEEKFQKVVNYLLNKNPRIEAIILFGSYARKTQNEQSDVDIAVKFRIAHQYKSVVLATARYRRYLKKRCGFN